MTNINSVPSTQNNTNTEDPSVQNTEAIRDSLAKVINALTGTSKSGANLANERLSEDVLYAALVHKKLGKRCAALADRYLTQLPKRYENKLDNAKRQPLYGAVDAFLNRAIRKGELSRADKNRLSRSAFGKAQLDDNASRLRRRVTDVTKGSQVEKTNVEATLEQVKANSRATRKNYKELKTRIANAPDLTPKQLKRNRSFLDAINAFDKTDENTTTVAKELPAPVSTETDRPAPLPDYNQIQTAANDFVFKPKSLDGNALVQLPAELSKSIIEMELHLSSGERIIPLYHSGFSDDGRSYFRAKEDTSAVEGLATIWMKRFDGVTTHLDLDSASDFYQESFHTN